MSDDATDPAAGTPRRREALEVSGWGERFVFVQPHNLCFWVYLALTAVGVFQVWSYFDPNDRLLRRGVRDRGRPLRPLRCSRGSCGSATSTGGSASPAGWSSRDWSGVRSRRRSASR